MARILITYWSGTGNTERMAALAAEGARAAGAEVDCTPLSAMTADKALTYDAVAIGSPSMGQEVIEETEVEPFVEDFGKRAAGRKVALFGSFGWGDGEWMRNWVEQMRGLGAILMDNGLIVHEAPEGDAIQECRDFGRRLAAFGA